MLLTLLGPVAVRVKATAPVVPGVVACVAGGDDAASKLQQQLLGGGAGEGVGRGGGQTVWVGAAQFDRGFFGFPSGQDGVDAARCPRKLVLQMA